MYSTDLGKVNNPVSRPAGWDSRPTGWDCRPTERESRPVGRKSRLAERKSLPAGWKQLPTGRKQLPMRQVHVIHLSERMNTTTGTRIKINALHKVWVI